MPDHIIHRIARRAREAPDAVAVRLVQDVSGATRPLTWEDLARGAWAARAEFLRRGLAPGDRILLMLPTGQPYINALLGSLWAGLAPTTLFPMTGEGSAIDREIRDLIAAFGPRALVGAAGSRDGAPQVIAPDCFESGLGTCLPEVPDDSRLQSLSYVQFTSGSTGKPRGLALHWPAIAANIETIACATGMKQGTPVMSWLPMYHDMGIFGALLTALHAGGELTLMDPSLFTANPLSWLRVIHERRASITVAPPSALRSCLQLLRRRPRMDLDLSCLTQVICGAEPIPPGLLPVFQETLGPYGVPGTALRPVYGMAEATLAVSFTPLGRGAMVDCVDRQKFEMAGVAVPVSGGDDAALEWVSAGRALPGIDLRVADEQGHSVPERRVGRVWVRSPSLYEAVLEGGSFQKRRNEWLDTGDLGYLVEDELYVTGRAKDVIIKNGRNYVPERLEQLASLIAGVRRCAAFGIFEAAKSTERIVLMIETTGRHLRDAEMRDRLRLEIRKQLNLAGYHVDEVCLVPKSTLSLTTSGKVRRRQCRETYLQQMMPSV